MIYFKRVEIENANRVDVESRIRKHSLRRHVSLDLQKAYTYLPESGKYFIGIESKRSIQITRIKNTFNRYLPKFIIRFDKADFSYCKIRPSWLSGFLAILLPFALLVNIFNTISAKHIESDLFTILVVTIFFFTLLFIEYRFTMANLHQVLKESDFSFEQ